MEINIISCTYQLLISGEPEVETSQTSQTELAHKLTLYCSAKKPDSILLSTPLSLLSC